MYDPWCGIGHSVLMLGTQDIGAHGKVLPQWGLLLSHWGWLIFIDNLPGFRLACIWLGRHFPTDLNEEGRSTLKGSGSIMGAEGPDWIEGRKEKTRWTWTFHVLGSLICSGINKYSYSSATAVVIADSSAVTASTLKHEQPKSVSPEVVSYHVFGKSNDRSHWCFPLSCVFTPSPKRGPIGMSLCRQNI